MEGVDEPQQELATLRPYIKGSPQLPRHPAALSKQGRRASFVDPATRNPGRKVGIPLATVAIFALSCDALLIKLAGEAGASTAVVIIVKYGATTCVTGCIVVGMYVVDRVRPLSSGLLLDAPTPRGRWFMAYAAVLGTIEGLCYTLGFAYTTSANVLAFAALAPMWSALFTWVYLSIVVPMRTRVAVSVALLGSGVVAYGVRNEFGADGSFDSVFGIICAIAAGVVGAANFTVYQAASITAPTAPMMLAELAGGLLSFAVGWAFLLNLHPPGAPLMPADPLGLVYLCLSGSSAVFDAMMVAASLLVSGTELALVCQVEAFLSPMLTFLVLAEVPSLFTMAGGLLIISVVGVNEVAAVAYPDERIAQRIHALTMVGLREYVDPTIQLEPLSSMGSLPKLPHVSLTTMRSLPHVRGRHSRVSDLSSVGGADDKPRAEGQPTSVGAGSSRSTTAWLQALSPPRTPAKRAPTTPGAEAAAGDAEQAHSTQLPAQVTAALASPRRMPADADDAADAAAAPVSSDTR